MIANNYRKHAEAMTAQMELDLSGTLGANAQQRGAWWTWLMKAGEALKKPLATVPHWFSQATARARNLSKMVKAACMSLIA